MRYLLSRPFRSIVFIANRALSYLGEISEILMISLAIFVIFFPLAYLYWRRKKKRLSEAKFFEAQKATFRVCLLVAALGFLLIALGKK
jgi:uncharacterized iron-regulated membrane protein